MLNPCVEIKGANQEVFEGEADLGRFPSCDSQKEPATGNNAGSFGALEGWMLARAPASRAEDLYRHRPRYYSSDDFCIIWP